MEPTECALVPKLTDRNGRNDLLWRPMECGVGLGCS
jgi:hypothetical protein